MLQIPAGPRPRLGERRRQQRWRKHRHERRSDSGHDHDTRSGGVAPTTTVLGGAASTPTPNPNAKFYTVASGDSCYAIAASYGVKVSDLIALNNLDADCTLHVGQSLQIPK